MGMGQRGVAKQVFRRALVTTSKRSKKIVLEIEKR